jgi:hypothetical protein
MKDVINQIDCHLLELSEVKEVEVLAELDSTATSKVIKELKVERALFNKFPLLLERIKTAKLSKIKFTSLSL